MTNSEILGWGLNTKDAPSVKSGRIWEDAFSLITREYVD